jgi:8-oxo-dGTP diphosphatase
MPGGFKRASPLRAAGGIGYARAMRRYGDPVVPGQKYANRIGAYAIVLDGRDVLVTEQAGPVPEIQLPGGGIDPGEGLLRALHRECLEEIGWRIAVARRLGAFQRYAYMPEYDLWARKVCHVFLARAVLRHGEPSDAGHRALWMPVETAARLAAIEGDRRYLADIARALAPGAR